jgi:O-antigen/teichoic acid export membrane protein
MKFLHKALAANFFSLSLVQVANSFLPIITFPIIARIIGPEKFGAISFAAAAVTYFTLLINYGFDLSSTRAIAKNKDDIQERNKVFSEVLFAKIFLLGISILVFRRKEIVGFYLPELFCIGYNT